MLKKKIDLGLLVYRTVWSERGGASLLISTWFKLERFSGAEGHFKDFQEIPGVQPLGFFMWMSALVGNFLSFYERFLEMRWTCKALKSTL